jgi:hypothetical protein
MNEWMNVTSTDTTGGKSTHMCGIPFLTATVIPFKSEAELQPTVFRSVCHGFKTHLVPKTRFLLLSDSCRFVDVECPLRRENEYFVYSWPLTAQSFSGPNPAGLMAMFLSQIRDSPSLDSQTPVFISYRNRVATLYTQALGSLFVACANQSWPLTSI